MMKNENKETEIKKILIDINNLNQIEQLKIKELNEVLKLLQNKPFYLSGKFSSLSKVILATGAVSGMVMAVSLVGSLYSTMFNTPALISTVVTVTSLCTFLANEYIDAPVRTIRNQSEESAIRGELDFVRARKKEKENDFDKAIDTLEKMKLSENEIEDLMIEKQILNEYLKTLKGNETELIKIQENEFNRELKSNKKNID